MGRSAPVIVGRLLLLLGAAASQNPSPPPKSHNIGGQGQTLIRDAVPCDAVSLCRQYDNCSHCLATLATVAPGTLDQVALLPNAELKLREARFFLALTRSCHPLSAFETRVLRAAIDELRTQPCPNLPNVAFTFCNSMQFNCSVMPECAACLVSVYNKTGGSAGYAISHGACRVDFNDFNGFTDVCLSFPTCSFWKLRVCGNDPTCVKCLDALDAGDSTGALACQNEGFSGTIMNYVGSECYLHTDISCTYFEGVCATRPQCQSCWEAIRGGVNVDAIVSHIGTPNCSAVTTRVDGGLISSEGTLMSIIFDHCTRYTNCEQATALCVIANPNCTACLQNKVSPEHWDTVCAPLLNRSGFGVFESCAGCPHTVNVINTIVMATVGIGAASAIGCMVVVGVVVAAGRHRTAARDRILVALLLTNAAYSLANAIPMSLLRTTADGCGQLALDFSVIRGGRSLWFGAKFGLLGYEMYILAASTSVLLLGSSALSRSVEIFSNVICMLVFVSVTAAFEVLTSQIQADGYNRATETEALTGQFNHGSFNDVLDDDGQAAPIAASKFQSAREEYDALLQTMLVVWNVLLGVALVLWIALRCATIIVMRRLRQGQDTVTELEQADEWRLTRKTEWDARRELLPLQREAYLEIVRPLEYYLVVFLVFGAPAVLMATDWCRHHSGVELEYNVHESRGYSSGTSTIVPGTCNVWCEFALAFRSLVTVAVYFASLGRTAGVISAMPTGPPNGSIQNQPKTLDLTPQPDDSWMVQESDIEFLEQLFQGNGSVVWRGRWRAKSVAVKELHGTKRDEDGDCADPFAQKDFETECATLSRLNHPHLLRYFGFGNRGNGAGFIVTEFMARGSLRDVLDTSAELPWRTRLSMALQVSLGMEYLHSIPIIHRDLKSHNVMVGSEYRAVVGDLGSSRQLRHQRPRIVYSAFTGSVRELPPLVQPGAISACVTKSATVSPEDLTVRLVDVSGVMTKAVGTLLWMAPEMFRGDLTYCTAVDVYSFGMVLWEVFTRELPWSHLFASKSVPDACADFREIVRALKENDRPTAPNYNLAEQRRFVAIMQDCWAGDPRERPTFKVVSPRLAACLRNARAQEKLP